MDFFASALLGRSRVCQPAAAPAIHRRRIGATVMLGLGPSAALARGGYSNNWNGSIGDWIIGLFVGYLVVAFAVECTQGLLGRWRRSRKQPTTQAYGKDTDPP